MKILFTLILTCWASAAAFASYSLNQVVTYDPSLMSAFGTLETADLTPVVQFDFVYGLNVQNIITNTANNGIVTNVGGMLQVISGSSANGSAYVKSRKPAKYRAGEGILARFTTLFGPSQPFNMQLTGPGNETDGYFFGYNTNQSFGICFRNYGTNFWIPQTNWNVDLCNGTGPSGVNWNTTNGMVCMVKYPFLGYGDIGFYIENPATARMILVHVIQYNDAWRYPQLSNPSLGFYCLSTNANSTTVSVTNGSGSVGFFLSGARNFVNSPKWAVNSGYRQGVATATETNLLTLLNATNYNGVPNRSVIRLNSITVGASVTSAGAFVINLRYNATVTNSSFSAINGTYSAANITVGNSCTAYDTTAGTYGGLMEWSTCGTQPANNQANNQVFDLSPYEIMVSPGDTITVSAQTLTGTVSYIVALTWTEDI